MLELNAKTTALVVIDLQEGILPFAGGPHTADEVVNRAGKLAAKFRASGQPVFLVRVGWSADYAEALKQPVDAPSPAKVLPENWWQHPAALGATDSDIEIIKRHIITTDKTDQRICRRQYSMYRNFRFFSLSVANSFTVWTCCMNRAAV